MSKKKLKAAITIKEIAVILFFWISKTTTKQADKSFSNGHGEKHIAVVKGLT